MPVINTYLFYDFFIMQNKIKVIFPIVVAITMFISSVHADPNDCSTICSNLPSYVTSCAETRDITCTNAEGKCCIPQHEVDGIKAYKEKLKKDEEERLSINVANESAGNYHLDGFYGVSGGLPVNSRAVPTYRII